MNITDKIQITQEDNMLLMARYPDNYFDLAIVDPPYGIARFGNRVELSNRLCKSAKLNEWDIKPTFEYFKELFRVSKFQIIWGANNFELPTSEYFIVWNKKQTVENFASAEYAWTNVKKPAQIFDYSIHKTMADRKEDGGKIHPTQKPVALYKWLLDKYAKCCECGGSGEVSSNTIDCDVQTCKKCKGNDIKINFYTIPNFIIFVKVFYFFRPEYFKAKYLLFTFVTIVISNYKRLLLPFIAFFS